MSPSLIAGFFPGFKFSYKGGNILKDINIENIDSIDSVVSKISGDYNTDRVIDKMDVFNQPDKDVIIDVIKKLQKIILPGYFKNKLYRVYTLKNHLTMLIEDVIYNLKKQIIIVYKGGNSYSQLSDEEIEEKAEKTAIDFLNKIPEIREYLETDLQAAFDGDPAAYSKEEIIFSYPGIYAILIYRIAHELYNLSVPIIPRIMTELAHSDTGIDIHPGAVIGKYFFIDHGTGIVIGETTVIGEHVKVYQGVTLGALSTRGGQNLRGTKRHPTIADNVTIYSGASILGGETVIGKNVVIGSNAFITKSIRENTKVSIKNQELRFTYDEKSAKIDDAKIDDDDSWFYII